ncbi:MAG: polynucleotide adenylyltransferase [Candidatus Thermofonsia Clade 1 bacterium]|uniref:Polynucleotide adenylyltransferase n=2 Tax=Candidatus Thermofonsia Clade 1 bacterium TaxID=2364210 RepID=A0A2M8P2Y4_9CHLR|nr:MAG: polynucleotide adenylyltransferase [Candidatus Thermofonsia Clade 1 bacterium]
MPITEIPAPFLLEYPPLVGALLPLIGEREAYLVGGAVRDALLRRPSHDLDLAVPDDGRQLARRIANAFQGDYYALDAERQVGRALVRYDGVPYSVDVARFRGTSLEEDLRGRDFTVNAIAIPLRGDLQTLIDPLNGVQDLFDKRLRRCTPEAIRADPIRALRAIRQSLQFKLLIERETRSDLRTYGVGILSSSPERVRDEFMSMLNGAKPQAALRALDSLGLLRLIVPEVEAMRGLTQPEPHIYDLWEHTLNAVERMDAVLTTISPLRTEESAADSALGLIVYLLDVFRPQLQAHLEVPLPNGRTVRALLILAALLHDCGKPATRSLDEDGRVHFHQHEIVGAEQAAARAEALRLSNEEMARLVGCVRHHMRPMHLRSAESLSRRAIYRFWKATGPVGVDVCLLTLADYLATVGTHLQVQAWLGHLQVVRALLEAYFNQHAQVVSPPPLIDGTTLMEALKLAPSRLVGQLLEQIAEAQASGEINTPEEALELARRLRTNTDAAQG